MPRPLLRKGSVDKAKDNEEDVVANLLRRPPRRPGVRTENPGSVRFRDRSLDAGMEGRPRCHWANSTKFRSNLGHEPFTTNDRSINSSRTRAAKRPEFRGNFRHRTVRNSSMYQIYSASTLWIWEARILTASFIWMDALILPISLPRTTDIPSVTGKVTRSSSRRSG